VIDRELEFQLTVIPYSAFLKYGYTAKVPTIILVFKKNIALYLYKDNILIITVK